MLVDFPEVCRVEIRWGPCLQEEVWGLGMGQRLTLLGVVQVLLWLVSGLLVS